MSFSFFLIWLIPCALAQNIETMLVARFLDGLAGSAFLSVAGGTIGDLFDRSQLQAPMMIYSASPFIGPPVGPIVAGFINYHTSWSVVSIAAASSEASLTAQALDLLRSADMVGSYACRDHRGHSRNI